MSDLRQEILSILEYFEGEVLDPKGRAVRIIYEEMPEPPAYTTISTMMNKMEAEGLIYRDMPNLKRTTRIAIAKPGVRPGRKSVSVVMEQASRQMAEMLETELHNTIDAHVAMALENHEPECDHVERIAEITMQKNNEIAALKGQLREANQEPTVLRAQLDQERTENAELREQLRIATHNSETWKRQALNKPNVKAMLSTVREHLDPQQTRLLETLMRELPSTR